MGPYVLGYPGSLFESFQSQEDAVNHFGANYPKNVKSGSGIVEGIEGITQIERK